MSLGTRIQLRRDTAANWTAANPVLAAAEVGVETDTGAFKIGDGTSSWLVLLYANNPGDHVPPSGDTTGATDTANINAQIAAGRLLRLTKGVYYINNKVDLSYFLAAGNDLISPQTEIICVNSGAGVVLQKSGGLTGGFRVNGNNVATQPLLVGHSSNLSLINAQSTYIAIDVVNSAQDGWVIQGSQNLGFYNCSASNNARDSLVLDYGCGGLVFTRFEGNAHGRYGLRVDESGTAPAGLYTAPQDIAFYGGEFERGTTDVPVARFIHGTDVRFDGTYFQNGVAPYSANGMEILSTFGVVTVDGIQMFLDSTASFILQQSNNNLCFCGKPSVFAGGAIHTPVGCIDNTANTHISIAPGSIGPTGVPIFKPGTEDGTFVGDDHWGYTFQHHHATGSIIEASQVDGDAGQRFRRLADGTLEWGDGTGFSFDTLIQRNAPGVAFIANALVTYRHYSLRSTPTYGPTTTVDMSAGEFATVTPTNTTALTITASNLPPVTWTEPLTIEVHNGSGGTMGAVTWDPTVFNLAGYTWTNPANGKSRNALFRWNGSKLICQGISPADY